MNKKKIAIGITGASGAIYAKKLFEKLKEIGYTNNEVSTVFTEQGKKVWDYELPEEDINKYNFNIYENNDFFAPIASGSADLDCMIICPCTAGTVGRIANGISNDLISRTADVVLKERKKLIILYRETPLNLIHIENLKKITLAGGIVFPAIPSFYQMPKTIDDLVDNVINRLLKLAEIEVDRYKWGERK